MLSSGREVDRNVIINGPAMDSFELFYVFLVFPVYWTVLFIQIVYLIIKPDVGIIVHDASMLDK
jgi:hypothetical protein